MVPHFDPAEVGARTRVLCVFEAPGPMTKAGNKRPLAVPAALISSFLGAMNGFVLGKYFIGGLMSGSVKS